MSSGRRLADVLREARVSEHSRRWLCKFRIPFGGAYVPCGLPSGHDGEHVPEER